MMRAIIGLGLMAAAAMPAIAQENEIKQGAAPAWVKPSALMDVPSDASGLVFARQHDVFVNLDARGQQQYTGYRLKLLHPNALQLGNLAISWNPAAGAPVLHALKIHRGGETIALEKSASFEILRREDQLEAAFLDGVLTAVLRVPDLRVGDELEVAFTVTAVDPTLAGDDAGLLFLAPDPPAGRFGLAVSWEGEQRPRLEMAPALQPFSSEAPNAVRFQFDNPPLVVPPKDAPPRFFWQRIVEYSDYPDWAAVSRKFAPLYASASQLSSNSPLKEEAARIREAHANPLARAAAALKLVQQQVRYIYVGVNGGNFTPASAEETWERRYGDCKGKTALLLALLRELDIEAAPVVVNNSGGDDGLDERLPNPGLFDHVLVRASIAGTDYWLDGTLPPVAAPTTSPVLPYRWVLPLAAEGRGLERLPWQFPQRPDTIVLHEIDARAGFEEPAQVATTTITRGIQGLEQQVQLSAVTPAQLLGAFQQNNGGQSWLTIDDVQWRYDQASQASILTITGTQTVDWDDNRNGKRLSLPGGGFNPPPRRIRSSQQDRDVPFANELGYSCHVTTVRLPEQTTSKQWSFNTSFDEHIFGRAYHRALEKRAGEIRMVRGSRVEQDEISAASARADSARVSDFDNSMAWIYYDPDAQVFEAAGGAKVPATYEIDWLADDVPCLAAD